MDNEQIIFLDTSPSYPSSRCDSDMAFGIVQASFASVITESILFGFFSVLFTLSSYLLLQERTVSEPLRTRFFCALSLMYALAVMHIGINIQRALEGFVSHYDEAYSALHYFSLNQGTLDISRMAVYTLQSLLGDGLMIYRLCIVCRDYLWSLAPAFILLLGSIVSGIGMMVAFSKQTSASPFMSSALDWMIAFFSFSFIINLGGTIAITIRIWLMRRKLSIANPTVGFSPLTVVLLDPGIIYSISLLVLFGLFLAESNALLAMIDWISQIIGIVLSLVIIRIGFKSLWNGKLDYTPPGHLHKSLEIPPSVPPKDWMRAEAIGDGRSRSFY